MWHFQVLWWKSVKFLTSFSKAQASFSSNFASLFSVMKEKSLILFRPNVLSTKGINQSPKFWDFRVLGSKLPNFCRFWNKKSVFLQILHNFSVLWGKIPLYLFSWNFIYLQRSTYQSTNLVKFQVSIRKSEVLHFDGLLCPNHINFKLKKYRKAISHSMKSDAKFKEKLIWHDEFGEFSPNHSKVKFDFHGFFLSIVYEVWAKKYRVVVFHGTEQCKIWINPDLVVLKLAWVNQWTFIRVLKNLQICTLMGSFCQMYIMFQLENFRGIMCYDIGRWCKI